MLIDISLKIVKYFTGSLTLGSSIIKPSVPLINYI